MKYTINYFRKGLPDWKAKKDPFISRIFYRPVSMYVACWCSNIGLSANTVSYMSAVIAIWGCLSFLGGNHTLNIIGAILLNIWNILDCVDGNIARSVKKQPFGPFADAMSSYIYVALLGPCIGYAAYIEGGPLVNKGCVFIILLGAFAGMSDTLMRLIYQKYKNTQYDLIKQGVLPEENEARTDPKMATSFKVRIEESLGVGGHMEILILLATIFRFLDLLVLYCLLYYGIAMLISIYTYTRKAIYAAEKYEIK